MTKAEALIKKYGPGGTFRGDSLYGRVGSEDELDVIDDVRTIAAMLKLAMEGHACEYPKTCPDPTSSELCHGCRIRAAIEAEAEGKPVDAN